MRAIYEFFDVCLQSLVPVSVGLDRRWDFEGVDDIEPPRSKPLRLGGKYPTPLLPVQAAYGTANVDPQDGIRPPPSKEFKLNSDLGYLTLAGPYESIPRGAIPAGPLRPAQGSHQDAS